MLRWWLLSLVLVAVVTCSDGKKKKSVLDYNDADVERIFREWEENDEESDDSDEFDPLKGPPRPKVNLDLEGLQAGRVKPEDLLRQSKKGQTLMMFVSVRGSPPDKARTESISSRWVQSLLNGHLQADRYIVADDRVLLVIKDGSQAWDIKDYLITQTDCTTVTLEQQTFDCASPEGEEDGDGDSSTTTKKKEKTEL